MARFTTQGQSVKEIMTTNLATLEPGASIAEAARLMRDKDTGNVLMTENGQLRGLVTDRDIAVRAVAEGKDPESTTIGEIATTDLATLDSSQTVEDAIALVRSENVRRIPIVENGKAVGVISIGDLAIERDEESALADISAAPQNN